MCNSDGYVGQVCVLSLAPEPSVTSCNSVCNARILCVESVPPSGCSGGASGDGDAVTANASTDATTAVSTSAAVSKSDAPNTIIGDGSVARKSLVDLNGSRDEPDAVHRVPTTVQHDVTSVADADTVSLVPPGDKDPAAQQQQQSTMWLGMEDGYVHVYNCSDNIRIKNTKIKIQHGSAVMDILYLIDQIFVSLASGEVSVYKRENGKWNYARKSTSVYYYYSKFHPSIIPTVKAFGKRISPER